MTSDPTLRCSAIWNGCRCGRPPHKDKDDRHVWMNTLDNGRAVDPALYPAPDLRTRVVNAIHDHWPNADHSPGCDEMQEAVLAALEGAPHE